MDNDYEMPILELSSEEVSLLQMCVALVLGGVFQDKVEAEKISKIFMNKHEKLEVLYSKRNKISKLKTLRKGLQRKSKKGKAAL